MSLRYGIDLGGTKIEIIAIDGSHECLRRRLDTPQGDYQATLQAIATLVREADQQLDGHGSVGIGIPGSASPKDGRIRNANSVCLIGQDLAGDLQRLLERPVRLANDADCFTLSEASDGAGAGAASVFGVIIGTGCGGGIVIDGKLLAGRNAIAGEWGHNPLPWRSPADGPARRCYCGKHDCIETFVSGPGWAARCGNGHDARELADLAVAGDALALQAVEQLADWLARSLATVINLLDPQVIVLGGGLSNIPALYPLIGERLPQWVFSDVVSTEVRQAQHGDSSGVRGAAWLWPEDTGL